MDADGMANVFLRKRLAVRLNGRPLFCFIKKKMAF
ncbi:hypothetical protein LRU_01640 [Ligilactobacillus ruminis SPM0211]|uniref:Uncharacterized protein n=1 Tax=Ligilactobacillus ruminis SPM0211 TaxID=1040964 RepID=F7R1R6_9LACO|nr:hypothetical protein LRU_01640 [Ligilactobacillus ruminis SPM0211]